MAYIHNLVIECYRPCANPKYPKLLSKRGTHIIRKDQIFSPNSPRPYRRLTSSDHPLAIVQDLRLALVVFGGTGVNGQNRCLISAYLKEQNKNTKIFWVLLIPVVPHEAVPEVSKGKVYINQKKNVPIESYRNLSAAPVNLEKKNWQR